MGCHFCLNIGFLLGLNKFINTLKLIIILTFKKIKGYSRIYSNIWIINVFNIVISYVTIVM